MRRDEATFCITLSGLAAAARPTKGSKTQAETERESIFAGLEDVQRLTLPASIFILAESGTVLGEAPKAFQKPTSGRSAAKLLALQWPVNGWTCKGYFGCF